jgi:hypothetical protein
MDPPLVCLGQAAVRITWPEELGVDGVERGDCCVDYLKRTSCDTFGSLGKLELHCKRDPGYY